MATTSTKPFRCIQPLHVIGVALVIGVSAPSAYGSGSSRKYEVRTAPGYAFPNGANSYHFVDNDRVIFIGASPSEMSLANKHVYSVRVWNWRTNEIKTIDRTTYLGLCYDGQNVRFTAALDAQTVLIKHGALDNIQTVSTPRKDLIAASERGEYLHPFHCRMVTPEELGHEGRCRFPLRDGDGLLDIRGRACRDEEKLRLAELRKAGPQNGASNPLWEYERQLEDRPIYYFETPGGEPSAMPFRVHQFSIYPGLSYAKHAQVYVFKPWQPSIRQPSNVWPAGLPTQVYLISRGGRVETISLPYDERVSGSPFNVKLASPGLIALSINVTRTGDDSRSGAYLWRRGKLEQITQGVLHDVQVSPNGCHIAFDAEQRLSKRVVRRMNVAHLC
jgi:hypothetical protein